MTSFMVKAIKSEKPVLWLKAHCILRYKRDSSQLQVHDEITGAKKKDNWIEVGSDMSKLKKIRENCRASHETSKGLSDDLLGLFQQSVEGIRKTHDFWQTNKFFFLAWWYVNLARVISLSSWNPRRPWDRAYRFRRFPINNLFFSW